MYKNFVLIVLTITNNTIKHTWSSLYVVLLTSTKFRPHTGNIQFNEQNEEWISIGKDKGKRHPTTGHEGPEGEQM